jgi:hypothetical protein
MAAAKAFFRSARAVTGVTPARVTTDGHDSYPRAIQTVLGDGVKHRTSQYLTDIFDKFFLPPRCLVWGQRPTQPPSDDQDGCQVARADYDTTSKIASF